MISQEGRMPWLPRHLRSLLRSRYVRSLEPYFIIYRCSPSIRNTWSSAPPSKNHSCFYTSYTNIQSQMLWCSPNPPNRPHDLSSLLSSSRHHGRPNHPPSILTSHRGNR